MVVVLFLFLLATLLFYSYGIYFISIFDKNNCKYSFFDSFFIGFCFIGTVLNVWSIFLPTDIFSIIFLILFGIYIFYKQKSFFTLNFKKLFQKIKKNRLLTLLVVVIILIQLLYSVGIPKNYDSYLYHINAIQWNEKFSVVPGLANLHNRFGFNSSQFVLSAAFSFNEIYNQYVFIINSLCFLIFLIWIVLYSFHKKDIFSIIALLFGYYYFYQYYEDFSSPSTDLIPNLLFGFLLIKLLFNSSSINNKYLLFVALSFFIITFKISLLPIITVGLLAIYFQKHKFNYLIINTFLFGSIFIIPWIIRNVIISGYLIYPLSSIDVFNFDWEVSKESIIDIQKWIYSWGRIPFKDHSEVLSMPFRDWFLIWWKNCILRNKVVFIISLLSPVFIILYYFNNRKIANNNVLIVFIVSFITFLIWLFTAPDIRFSFTALLILCAFPFIFLKKYIYRFTNVIKISIILFSLFFFYEFLTIGSNLFLNEFKSFKKVEKYYYLPNDVYYVKYNRRIEFNQIEYITPKGLKIKFFEPKNRYTQCFDKFPCSWYLDNSFNLRGEKINNGFINNNN